MQQFEVNPKKPVIYKYYIHYIYNIKYQVLMIYIFYDIYRPIYIQLSIDLDMSISVPGIIYYRLLLNSWIDLIMVFVRKKRPEERLA